MGKGSKIKYGSKDVWAYMQGNCRSYLYYSKYFGWLLPKHIREQIDYRINAIKDTPCWDRGSCVKCGCMVPQLQMANKACLGKCYPKMMGRYMWEFMKKNKNED